MGTDTEVVVLAFQLVAAAWMAAAIWIVQLLTYPSFASIDPATWTGFHARHSNLITPIVGPAMLLQLLCSTWLVLDRPAGIAPWATWLGVALVLITWGVTLWVSATSHRHLAGAFDAPALRSLVRVNWIRTVAWTALVPVALLQLVAVAVARPGG
ncbi:MAG: hypothetical protein JWM86_2426 [Thermoleophilia bacterium]|nr:hypothetical protein [Thermoleophilia bacterium]